MPEIRVSIVADDLTGACDAAVGFSRAGFSAEVLFARGEDAGGAAPRGAKARGDGGAGGGGDAVAGVGVPPGVDVVALDARSRHAPGREAAMRVGRAVEALRDAPLLIKKLDSTLRGNVAAELEAALAASGRAAALVAPAFPRYGRTTRGGIQYLDGVPVHEGFAGADPITPARTSDLLELLPGARLLSRGGDVAAALRRGGFVVADAETDDDLDALVRQAPQDVLWAGSTGLTQAFGRVLHGSRHPVDPPPAHRVAVAVGSLNPLTRRQLARLRHHDDPRVTIIASPVDEGDDPLVIARALGEDVRAAVDAGTGAVVLTGGDTAAAALDALGTTGFAVLDEVEPGVPLGLLRGAHPIPAVTKAGGFGSEDALVAATRALLATARALA